MDPNQDFSWVYEPWHCDICNLDTTLGYRAKHQRTKKHLANEANFKSSPPTDSYTEEVKCEICDVAYKPKFANRHVKTKCHLDAMKESTVDDTDIDSEYSYDLTRLVDRFKNK